MRSGRRVGVGVRCGSVGRSRGRLEVAHLVEHAVRTRRGVLVARSDGGKAQENRSRHARPHTRRERAHVVAKGAPPARLQARELRGCVARGHAIGAHGARRAGRGIGRSSHGRAFREASHRAPMTSAPVVNGSISSACVRGLEHGARSARARTRCDARARHPRERRSRPQGSTPGVPNRRRRAQGGRWGQ